MAKEYFARLVYATGARACAAELDLEDDSPCDTFGMIRGADLPRAIVLAEPFANIPVLPETATYEGEPIAVVWADSWAAADYLVTRVQQVTDLSAGETPAVDAPGEPHEQSALDSSDEDAATGDGAASISDAGDSSDTSDESASLGDSTGAEISESATPKASDAPSRSPATSPSPATMHREEGSLADAGADYQIVEGSYATSIQLHMPDAPFTVVARPGAPGSVDIHVPTQWPTHVRETVAAALSIAPRAVSVTVTPVTGSRDAALWLPSLMAIVAALAARAAGAPVTLSQRRDDRHRTGGRAPAQIRWTSRVNADGKLISNDVTADLNGGAYPYMVDETMGRMWASVRSVYRLEHAVIDATVSSSPAPPLGAFEGVGTAPMALARELHLNRLAEIAEQDPVIWRQRHIRRDWPVISELCATLAAESDFHRRYSANELVRKRRIQLPRNSATLKGIGFALSDQMSGFVAGAEGGSVAVRLEPDGVARISCSLPTPTPRLKNAWRELVANQLDLEVDSVYLDTEIDLPSHDSGPRLFSRGTSVVPRTLTAICQAINKQRFREPLPIHVRRTIKPSRAAKSPADAHHAAGAATVEVVLLPGSMEIEVRSVTIAVYAGRIMDRGMAESEIRRGVHQALAWVLHEAVPDPERASSRETVANYPINFRGRSPRIKIILGNAVRKDGPTGLGELPFLTVPAALLSALSQASGLYLDSVPVRPASILRMLMEES